MNHKATHEWTRSGETVEVVVLGGSMYTPGQIAYNTPELGAAEVADYQPVLGTDEFEECLVPLVAGRILGTLRSIE